MPIGTKYLFSTSMDVTPEREALFNEVYDTEHVPALLKVPGVLSITRMKAEPFSMVMAGATRHVDLGNEPAYTAVYEIESPDVLTSDAWAEAVEQGRWPTEVRPYTSNGRQVMRQVLDPKG